MREALFSSLGPAVEGRSVADLFAGTGSYGLEALSRGAARARFFETDRAALACLRENIRAVLRSCAADTECAEVVPRDVFKLDLKLASYDLIFLDPPYAMIQTALADIFAAAIGPIATPDARVLAELPGNFEPTIDGWEMTRRIGKAGRDKPSVALFQRC
jgi:16S rRNA (guanine966-N2)-methyltransferase